MIASLIRHITVSLVVLLAAPTLYAQDSDGNKEAVASAMAALDEFMSTFNARDPVAWAASLNYPHVRFASGTVTVWETAEEFARGESFERLAAIGWDP